MADPDKILTLTAVWTPSFVPLIVLVSKRSGHIYIGSDGKPINNVVSRLKSSVVEPTAAREVLPAKRPTTITSAALNRSCRQLDSIKGKLNAMTFVRPGHCTYPFYRILLTSLSPPFSTIFSRSDSFCFLKYFIEIAVVIDSAGSGDRFNLLIAET